MVVKNINSQKKSPGGEEPSFLTTRVNSYFIGRVQNTWNGGNILRGKSPRTEDVHLYSNDYLSIASHSDLVKAQVSALESQGNGPMMSAVFFNEDDLLYKVENKIADFMNAESALISQSGWCANTSLIQSVADEHTPVYIDMMAHMSLWEGIVSAGAKPIKFRHNDAESLEKLVRTHGIGVVVVDSVYSTNGSVCPLSDIVDVAERYGCIMVVDESHSLGTHGPEGRGMVVGLGLEDKVHFRTSSLAKAFAGRGGVITGTARHIEYIKHEARPAIFSSAVLPQDLASFSSAIDIIKKADNSRQRLHFNSNYLRNSLREIGYNMDEGQAQIIALEGGPEPQTLILRNALEDRGVFGAVFCAPATPQNRSLIRMTVNADLTKDELDRTTEVCKAIRDEVGMKDWASTRRLKRKRKAQTTNVFAKPHKLKNLSVTYS